MPAHYHAVLWIDHLDARIIHFNAESAEEAHIEAFLLTRHLHAKAGSPSGTHIINEPRFFAEIIDALGDAHAVLIAGPSSAKTEFLKYLQRHAPLLAPRIAGIETLGHVTDHQLLAAARRFFAKADRMRPLLG